MMVLLTILLAALIAAKIICAVWYQKNEKEVNHSE